MNFFKTVQVNPLEDGSSLTTTNWFCVEPSNILSFIHQTTGEKEKLMIQFTKSKDYVETYPVDISPRATKHIQHFSDLPKSRVTIAGKDIDVYVVSENIKVNRPILEEVTENVSETVAWLNNNTINTSTQKKKKNEKATLET